MKLSNSINEISFDYYEAFSRNIGFVTPSELRDLRRKKVAIAGMGGVGGFHLLTLVRLGVTKFHIADFDKYELANFNRQVGATTETIGKEKVEVMCRMAQEINPEVEIKTFSEGVTDSNRDAFLEGVDLFVDGFDVFVLEGRREVFMACYEKNIPAITVGPLGMGFALVNFLPGQMSFDEYWPMAGTHGEGKYERFLIGLSPSGLHRESLVYRQAFDLKNGRTASTPMGCHLSTGIMGTEALKILLGRGEVIAAPDSLHYDGYSYQLKKSRLSGGTNSLMLKLKIKIAKMVEQIL